jgi:hypothetical protein
VIITETKVFNPDPLAKFKKKFPVEPKSHAEIRDCHMDLSSEMLQKIFAGPSTIDFGKIFTKSVASRTFQVLIIYLASFRGFFFSKFIMI